MTFMATVLDRAAQAGMEVSRARFDVNGARDELTNARVLGELLFRRKGLAFHW